MRTVLPTAIVAFLWLAYATPAAAQFQEFSEPPPRQSAPPPDVREPPPPISQFLGGIPAGQRTAEPLSLSIADAIRRALAQNLGLLLSEDGITRADGSRTRVFADLLPNIMGRVSFARQEINLAAYGFPLPAGIPSVVGPFNLFDARVYLTQNILDFKARNDARAEAHKLTAARYDYKGARDLVVLVAVDSYAQALAAAARVTAARAQVETATVLHNQAKDLKQNGIVAGIDVLRAELQVDTTRQLVTTAETGFEKAKLQLARLIGLPIGQDFTLTDQLSSATIPDMTLEQALERAYRTRPDYLAALERIDAADAARQAARGERLPAVRLTGNFGDIGVSVADSHSTFALVGAVDVPIFQGRRDSGRLAQAEADLRSRRADAEDLKASIYYDVRSALLDMQAGNQQLEVAARSRELAARQLNQARDRFAAGVTGNVEVVQAQTAVTQAADQYIAAIFTANVAKGALVRAVGIAEETARQTFGELR